MPNLRDAIMRGGNLEQTSSEELAALAGRSNPINPLESAVIGANPDQAKMAGTPGQKASAIRTSIQGMNDLGTAVRQGQGRTAATAEEKKAQQQGKNIGKLSSLESRVDTLVQNSLKAPTTAAVATDTLIADPNLPADQQTLVNNLIKNPKDTVSLQKLNTMMGYTDANQQLSSADLLAKTTMDTKKLGGLYATNVADSITAGSLLLKDMGFNADPLKAQQELADALGVGVNDLKSMSVQQLIDTTNNQIANLQKEQQFTESKLTDPNIGPAERAQARKQLRDMGAVGVLSANTELDKIADDIENSASVKVFGQEMPIDKALSDENLSGVIANVADGLDENGNPITDFAKEFMNNPDNKGIADWVKQNLNVVKQATANIDQAQKDYTALQQSNKDIAKAKNGEFSLSDEAMSDIFPDWGQQKTEAYDITQYPLLNEMRNGKRDAVQMNNLGEFIKTVENKFPHMMGEFAKLPIKDLEKLGAFDKNNTSRALNFAKKMDEIDLLNDIRDTGSDTSMAKMFGANSLDELKSFRSSLIQAHNFGTISDDEYNKFASIDGFKDGNWKKVKAALVSSKSQNWADVVKNIDTKTLSEKMSRAVQEADAIYKNLPSKGLASAFKNDNVIDSKELKNYLSKDTEIDNVKLGKFIKNNKDKFKDDKTLQTAKDTYNKQSSAEMITALGKALGGDSKTGADWLGKYMSGDKGAPDLTYKAGDLNSKAEAEGRMAEYKKQLVNLYTQLGTVSPNVLDDKVRTSLIKELKAEAKNLVVKQQAAVVDKTAEKGTPAPTPAPVKDENKVVAYRDKDGNIITQEELDRRKKEYYMPRLGQVDFRDDFTKEQDFMKDYEGLTDKKKKEYEDKKIKEAADRYAEEEKIRQQFMADDLSRFGQYYY